MSAFRPFKYTIHARGASPLQRYFGRLASLTARGERRKKRQRKIRNFLAMEISRLRQLLRICCKKRLVKTGLQNAANLLRILSKAADEA
jgi:hypothetical protein